MDGSNTVPSELFVVGCFLPRTIRPNSSLSCNVLFAVLGGAVEPSAVKRELINAYGAVKAEDESKIQRSTVLIDKEGKIAAVWFPV